MKKRAILIMMGLAVVAFSIEANAIASQRNQDTKTGAQAAYPVDVKKVIDNKCFGCHNPDSKSEKAKGKLDWTALLGLEKSVQVSKLDKVIEELDKGDMPPKKMIEMHPDAKISEADAKILKDWAQATSDNLMK
jgi:mono/diheme cytochrome c family protein